MLPIPGYTLVARLGESAHSLLYRAICARDQQPVVLKLPRDPIPTPEYTERLYHEHDLLRGLDLPGVLRCYRLEQLGQRPILVLEDFAGAPLDQQALAGQLDLPAWLALALVITACIDQVHQAQLTHKAVTPANLLYHQPTGQVKLIEFGQATRLRREGAALQSPGVLEGALAYSSPEQTGRMSRAVDYRTDLYALGVTLYELLVCQLPFASDDPLELVHAHLARLPAPPHQVSPRVPPALSAIVLKLLAKSADERYQSARGLLGDLAFCREHLGAPAALADFAPGSHDRAERFQIPQALYGRAADVAQLVAAFERSVGDGRELFLVAGPPGIGKTALVNESHRPVAARRGAFVGGKFDQLQRSGPYRAWVQAFSDLIAQLLTASEVRLAAWRAAIEATLGDSASVLTTLIPNLELILGPQPPAPPLEGKEAQSRLEFLLRGFVRALARPEHPLTIFLDDLQWADATSLSLLQLLLSDADTGALLLIGAYRDSEVGPAHPLLAAVADLRQAGTRVKTLVLGPLSQGDATQLIADTLACPADLARPFAALLYQKTQGNPFFTTRLLQSLYEDRLIIFNTAAGYWETDMAQVRAYGLSDDVVAFLAQELQKLPPDAQALLALAACIGGQLDLETLALAAGQPASTVGAAFWPALQAGLMIPTSERYQFRAAPGAGAEQAQAAQAGPTYRFLHDQVQQAAYARLAEGERQAAHLRIGRRLLAHSHEEAAREARLFEIVHQLNRGSPLLSAQAERDELAELNLQAGQQARAAAAFAVAREFFDAGIDLLGAGGWQRQYELTLRLSEAAAEAAYLCGDFAAMERLGAVVLAEARDLLDTITVYETRIQGLVAQSRFLESIQLGLDVLRRLGVHLPEQPGEVDVGMALQETQAAAQAQPIAALIDLPPMSDPTQLARMRLYENVISVALVGSPALYILLSCKLVTSSIQYGNTAISSHGYGCYAHFLCGVLGDIETGHQFGKLAADLQRKLNAKAFECKVQSMVYGFVNHWKDPIRDSLLPLHAAYLSGIETGDYQIGGYSGVMYALYMAFLGTEKSLSDLRDASLAIRETLVRIRHMAADQYLQFGLQMIDDLIGGRPSPRHLQGAHYDEQVMLPRHLEANDRLALFILHSGKQILNYLFGSYAQAVEDGAQAEPYQDGAMGFPYVPLFVVYDSLARIAAYRAGRGDPDEVQQRVESNQARLAGWAQHAPTNWQHAWDLVEAERQRSFGQAWEALEAYDRAIAGASAQGFLRETALANERAAEFYLERGKELLAHAHLQAAHAGYAHWGATAKVAQIEQRHPHLLAPQATAQRADAGGRSLDLDSVIKAAQAVAGEIALDRLLARLMRLVIASAGAQRGALLLERDGAWVIEAQGEAERQEVAVLQAIDPWTSDAVSPEIIAFVARTRRRVVLDDAARAGEFRHDPYLTRNQIRSVLGLALINQGQLSGILYLENNLTPGAFPAERLELLSLLSTQMALALDHARLYHSLEARGLAVQAHAAALSASNAELARALRLKDEFLAMMSHELRTPLTAVLSITEAMAEHDLYGSLNTQQREALGHVMQSGRHLLGILSDILDLAQIAAGTTTLDREPVDVDLLCLTALHYVQAAAQQKRLNMLHTVEEGIAGLHADERRLTQILVNLLDNAVKFTPAGGSVGLEATVDSAGERVVFVVWDTGIGIAKADYERLFQPFTQVDGRLTRQYGGIGLGLSLVRRLVDLHGGSVSLESTPGQGSRFSVSLPWANDNAEPRPARAAEPPLPAWAQPPRIVLADDHELTLAFYRDLLAAQGCQVALARTGLEAVAQVRATRPDVAVLDIQMPELDGLGAIRQIRADPQVGATPIIALTALAMPGDHERCLAAGASVYLTKPVSIRTLTATIAEALRSPS